MPVAIVSRNDVTNLTLRLAYLLSTSRSYYATYTTYTRQALWPSENCVMAHWLKTSALGKFISLWNLVLDVQIQSLIPNSIYIITGVTYQLLKQFNMASIHCLTAVALSILNNTMIGYPIEQRLPTFFGWRPAMLTRNILWLYCLFKFFLARQNRSRCTLHYGTVPHLFVTEGMMV